MEAPLGFLIVSWLCHNLVPNYYFPHFSYCLWLVWCKSRVYLALYHFL